MQLPTTQLGSTGMEITRIGVGAWAIGGSWGPQDDEKSIAAIHRAVELGVNWIDTAHAYGWGHSESIVGRAIEGLSPRPYVFTKCSILKGTDTPFVQVLKRESIRRELEGSLERLGVDAIDLYQIHHPTPEEDIDEGWTTLNELKDEGLVRHIGVSNFTAAQMRAMGSIAPVESLQPPYSLIDREAESELFPYVEEAAIGVIVYSPMYSGLLTGRMTKERIASLPAEDWRREDPEFQAPKLDGNLALVERIRSVATRLGASPGAVAIAWTLRHPAVNGAIVGFRNPRQVDDVIGGAALELDDACVDEITPA
jgi:aryl-alcohol dehydrogenase-like predicted oxidoreductase